MASALLSARLLRLAATASSSPLATLGHRWVRPSVPCVRAILLTGGVDIDASSTPRTRSLASHSVASATSEISEKENLLQLIDTEIGYNVSSDDNDDYHVTNYAEQDGPQEDSSFQLISNCGLYSMTLKREFDGEIIKAVVNMRYVKYCEPSGEDDICPVTGIDRYHERAYEETINPCIKMVITVAKAEGPIFEFHCKILCSYMKVEKMRVINCGGVGDSEYVYRGSLESAFEDSLQNALCRYLEVRGITPEDSLEWIHEYMRSDEEYSVFWLQNLKAFIAK